MMVNIALIGCDFSFLFDIIDLQIYVQSRRIYCKEGQCTYLFLFLPSIVYYLQASMKWGRVLKLPHFEEFFKLLIVVLQFVRRLPCCTAGSDREAALIGEFDLLPDPAAAAAASVADEIETGPKNNR
ncbi:hypothetical protein TB1_031206 [Malus domestica]